jgi:hypothetical protein
MTSFVPGQIDPNVKIPNAIKATAAKADAAFQAMYGQNEEPNQDGVQETNEAETPAPAEAKAPETAASETTEVTSKSNDQSAPKADDDQSWEHRYKSMKGRYDRADSQLRQMSEQITSLQNVIATMELRNPAPTQQMSDTEDDRLITPEEEQDYGSEFLNVVGKKAKEEILRVSKKYESKIAELEAKLQGVDGYVTQDARTRMENSLDERIPKWRDVNFDPEFLSWLKLPDPYSGVIRHELLKAAYQRNDTPRVLAFFNGFLAEEAAVDPANGETGRTEAPAKMSLEKLAAPGRAKTAAASGAPAEKPIFTRADIAKFYADSASGKFRGKEAEKNRLEAQIFEAEREGRIR